MLWQGAWRGVEQNAATATRQMQGDGVAAAVSAVASFGFDTIKYEVRVIPESWRVRQSDNTTVEVTRKRVMDLFGKGYAVEVQQQGLNGHKSKTPFIDVPVGACRIPRLSYFPVSQTELRFLQQRRIPATFNFITNFDESMVLIGSLVASDGSVNCAITIT
jgi:hypothetical protein